MHEVDVPTYGARLMLVSVYDDTLRVWTVRNKVDWINVGSPMLRTSDSIRVGASITGLLGYEQLEGGVGDGDDVFVLYVPSGPLCGLSFVLDPQSALALSRAQKVREAFRTIQPTPRISAVWVLGDRQC